MLFLCINAASASETLDTNLTGTDASDIVSVGGDDIVAGDSGLEVLGDGDMIVGDGGYSSISAAVSAANGGETIFIKNGTYTESSTILIKNSLNIVGESQDGVKITGPSSSSLFKGSTDNDVSDFTFTLNNVTILNTGSEYYPAILFTYYSHDINLINCTFDGCGSNWGTIQFGHPGTGVIDGCKILNSKCTATAGSGAVYLSNDGIYSIKNTVIDDVQCTLANSLGA